MSMYVMFSVGTELAGLASVIRHKQCEYLYGNLFYQELNIAFSVPPSFVLLMSERALQAQISR